jgi:hypothetical protein
MYLYQFLSNRYQDSYRQIKCVISYMAMLLPIMAIISIIRHSFPFVFHALLFLTGWCTWTFIEYILHRFWMHDKSSNSAMAQTHHHHHTHPTEIIVTNMQRLIMLVVVVILFLIAGRLDDYFTGVVGLFFGIEGYFMMHQFLHLKISQRIFKKLVRYHIYHHCKYPNTCYGVSVPWWDDIFKTVPTSPKLTQRIIDFYFKGNEKESQHFLRNAASDTQLQLIATKNCNGDCSACHASLPK